jgi:hypothetical protein
LCRSPLGQILGLVVHLSLFAAVALDALFNSRAAYCMSAR